MMHMTFYWGKDVTILFDFWRVRTWPWYLASLVALALSAALTEWVAGVRSAKAVQGEKAEEQQRREESEDGDRRAPLISRAYPRRRRSAAAVGALFGLQTALGYLLMLAAMSFNGGVFVAIVVGFAAGHALFRSDDAGRGEGACGAC